MTNTTYLTQVTKAYQETQNAAREMRAAEGTPGEAMAEAIWLDCRDTFLRIKNAGSPVEQEAWMAGGPLEEGLRTHEAIHSRIGRLEEKVRQFRAAGRSTSELERELSSARDALGKVAVRFLAPLALALVTLLGGCWDSHPVPGSDAGLEDAGPVWSSDAAPEEADAGTWRPPCLEWFRVGDEWWCSAWPDAGLHGGGDAE